MRVTGCVVAALRDLWPRETLTGSRGASPGASKDESLRSAASSLPSFHPLHPSAVQCPGLTAPDEAQVSCVHPLGTFSYQSTCTFTCGKGFHLLGAGELRCSAAGRWSAALPECHGESPRGPRVQGWIVGAAAIGSQNLAIDRGMNKPFDLSPSGRGGEHKRPGLGGRARPRLTTYRGPFAGRGSCREPGFTWLNTVFGKEAPAPK